jgi:hypothetical protein
MLGSLAREIVQGLHPGFSSHTTHPFVNVDTNCTALSLMPTIIGNTFAASLRHGLLSAAKGSSSTSHARNLFNLNFLTRLSGLMVRRWRLIGYFPILYNPFVNPTSTHRCTAGLHSREACAT